MTPPRKKTSWAAVCVSALLATCVLFYKLAHTGDGTTAQEGEVPPPVVPLPELGPEDITAAQASALPRSTVQLPEIGKIETRRTTRKFNFQDKNAEPRSLELTIHYTPDGRFVRAEFQSAAPKNPIYPVEEVEYLHRQANQKITGLPNGPMKVGLEELLRKTCITDQSDQCDLVEVSYVMFSHGSFTPVGEPRVPKSVIIIKVIGPRESRLEYRGPVHRARYIFNEKGNLIFVDVKA